MPSQWKTFKQFLLLAMMSILAVACGGQPEDDLEPIDVFPPAISVTEPSALEGSAIRFDLTLEYGKELDLTVDYTVIDDSATGGSDFVVQSGTLTFPSFTTTLSLDISTLPDTLHEADEVFRLQLSNPLGIEVPVAEYQAVIIDDDPEPTMSVSDVSVVEGGSAQVVVSLSEPSGRVVSFNYTTVDGTAVVTSDYPPTSGSDVVLPGDVSRVVMVPTTDDFLPEADETFILNINSVTGATPAVLNATITIAANDAGNNPMTFISDMTVSEPTDVVFTVTFEFANTIPMNFDYQAYDGTASLGFDFAGGSATETVPSGQLSHSFTISTIDDTNYELTESFQVSLSNFVNLNGNELVATATVNDDDSIPDLTVSDGGMTEGGSTVLRVSLSSLSSLPVTFDYSTTSGTASSGLDYAALSGAETIPPMFPFLDISVLSVDDSLDEGDESFSLDLTSVVGATPLDTSGSITLADNDAPPLLFIDDGSASEGETLSFNVSLSDPSSKQIIFTLQTYDGEAVSATDYVTSIRQYTLNAGETTVSTQVVTTDDLTLEASETFSVTLQGLINAQVGDVAGVGSIVDNDSPPDLTITDAIVWEGETAQLLISLSQFSAVDSVFDYTTVDGVATSGGDYQFRSGTLTIPAGNLYYILSIITFDDSDSEASTEGFQVSLSNFVDVNPLDEVSDLLIQDDDSLPYLYIDDMTLVEGSTFLFLVTLSSSPLFEVSFDYQTLDGTAVDPSDYGSVSGAVTMAVGQMAFTIPVLSVDNALDESDKVFQVSLSDLGYANEGDMLALGTITDDDVSPSVFVQDVSLTEGSTLQFIVSLSQVGGQSAEFSFVTVDIGSAQVGVDYAAVAVAVTIPAGQLAVTVPVISVQESLFEADEFFQVTLSSLLNLEVGKDYALGGIVNDDLAPQIFIETLSVSEGDTAGLVVSLSEVSGVDAEFLWETLDGTAVGGVDFTAVSPVGYTLSAGGLTGALTVLTAEDLLNTGDREFQVSLSGLVNAVAGVDVATVSIVEDDLYPDLVIFDTSLTEGGTAELIVSLSSPGFLDIVFDYTTVNGTATSGGDFTSASGTITLLTPGLQVTLSVGTIDDIQEEALESFAVSLSGVTNAIVLDDYGIASLIDNDASLFIDDVSVSESGTFQFLISLSKSVGQDVSFSYTTSDGSATVALDYSASMGQLTIPGGSVTTTISVVGLDDSVFEGDETFDVILGSLSGVLAGDIVGVGTLLDDDPAPLIFVSDGSATEGGTVAFLISLSEISGQDVSFYYSTYDIGDAIEGVDFTPAATGHTIVEGQLSVTLSAATIEDTLYEASEVFHVSLTSLVNAQVGDVSGDATITDNDLPPDLFVVDAEVDEGVTGFFTVSLSVVSGQDVVFQWDTFDGSAVGGVDYSSVVADMVTLLAGSFTLSLPVVAIDDGINQGDLLFSVSVSAVVGASAVDDVATITIDDDEGPPDAPTSLVLFDPGSTPSNDTTPELTVGGVFDGYYVRLYTDASCSSPVIGAMTVGTGPSEEVLVTTPLSEGLVTIFATQEDLSPSESFCSTVSLVYEVDITAPAAATALSLAGDYAPNGTTAPLFSWVQSGSPDVIVQEVALGTSSGGEEVITFSGPDTATTHSFSSLTLSECSGGLPVYWPSIKVVDNAGNETVATHPTGFRLDTTNPGSPGVPAAAGDAATDRASTVSWSSGSDNCQVASYELAIGTSPGATDVVGWMDVGDVSSYQAIDGVDGVSVTISNGVFYYTSLRTVDEVGLTSSTKTSAAWRFVVAPDAITDLGYAGRTKSSVDLSWSAPNDNGAPISDYTIEYKNSTVATWTTYADGVSSDTTATVDGLLAATSYDFRVKAYNGGLSSASNTISQETAPDDPFFDPSLFSAMNCGGATASAFVAFDDNTQLVVNGTTTLSPLNAGEVTILSTAVGDVVTSDKPFFAAGKLVGGAGGDQGKGNIVWNSPNWAGKEFIMVGSRDAEHVLTVYAFEEAVITITRGGVTEVDGVTVAGGSFDTYRFSNNAGYKITSTADIVAYQYSESGSNDRVSDNMPVLPPSTDIIGISSRTGQYTTIATSTNYQWWESDGSTSGADSVNQGVFDSAGGNGSQYSGPAARAIGDDPLMARSNADSDGYDSAPYIPKSFQRQRYAINNLSEWTAFASDKPAVIQVFEPGQPQFAITLSRTGSNANEPYFGRLTGLSAGTLFESNTRFGMWYESDEASEASSSREDETVMFGYDGVGLPVHHKLKLWLDANDEDTLFQQSDCTSVVASNNDPVGCWKDKSLQGNDVTQSTGGSRPLWSESVTGFGGKSGVNFNGSTQFMNFNETILDSTNYTVFAIVHRDTSGSNNFFMGTQTASPNQGFHMGYDSDASAILGQYSNDVSVSVAGQSENSVGLFWGRLSSSGKEIYYNGLSNSDVTGTQLSSPGQGVIGRGFDTNGFDGQVAEIIVFSRALSDGEIKLMKTYLKEKWLRPTLVSDVRLWLDGSDKSTMFTDSGCSTGVSTPSDTVACWRDKAGNGYDAIGSSGTVQWVSDSGAPVVQFSNGSLTISGGASGAVFSNGTNLAEAEVFAWTKSSNGSETGVLFDHPAGTGFNASVPYSGNVQWQLGSGTGSISGAWGGNTSSYYLWNLLSDTGSQDIYRDTSLITSDSDSSSITIGTESFTVGAASGNTNYQNINIGTLLIYSRALNVEERHMIRAYLNVHLR